ncbi:bacillithiol biosynthesis cysteine-adding enzyme BshC [Chitinophaga horti]|uniref:Putative cysteine ligase BshC n=1 Tax=Chitinophaga horti TaxID=2920382 RepID=A0ABY6J4T2_9BACT|nr:bacillithiol biosynthesis cysteine-adding enzyme BshC [Chitinophaga horti]UYQ94685.1 bacillithiol biosynthesis cysteine-adding enzyme BshC [Chitinophaga horti]
MKQGVHHIPYSETGFFSQLVADFLAEHPSIRPFYQYSPVKPDFEAAIRAKSTQPLDRELLVKALTVQYSQLEQDEQVKANIQLLGQADTYSVCTAHQPNIFTGYLYFICKILQTIKLAGELTAQFPGKHFVPVYYMGSEDADLDELGSIYLGNEKLTWKTDQAGAVGRMKTDGLQPMIDGIMKHVGYGPHAAELKEMLDEAYLHHENIQEATLYLVNRLFGRYGLVVLVPDTPLFKQQIKHVLKEELWQQSSYKVVSATTEKILQHHKVQASPREINLFYLQEGSRERIVKEGEVWKVLHTNVEFNEQSLKREIDEHPERFSPNVILRGILQETILPNIAFIGGGGEIAYWVELKALFGHHNVPYPVLLLRNSFLWVDKFSAERLQKLNISITEFFQETELLINSFVLKHTNANLVLKKEYDDIEILFAQMETKAKSIDVTLVASVNAELKKAMKSLGKIEHKFLRAEKKKFAWQSEQIRQLKARLFPGNSLQERRENFLPYYAEHGPAFFDRLLEALTPVTDKFCVITEEA